MERRIPTKGNPLHAGNAEPRSAAEPAAATGPGETTDVSAPRSAIFMVHGAEISVAMAAPPVDRWRG
jgi:hypothetical protein